MTGQILLAWLKLLAMDGDLARAEPRTLRPDPARRRPAGPRRAAPPPENPGNLAIGLGHHDRMAAHRRAAASPLTSAKPSLPSRKETPGARGTPATGPPAGPPSYPDAKIHARNAAQHRSTPAINPDERSGLGDPEGLAFPTTSSHRNFRRPKSRKIEASIR